MQHCFGLDWTTLFWTRFERGERWYPRSLDQAAAEMVGLLILPWFERVMHSSLLSRRKISPRKEITSLARRSQQRLARLYVIWYRCTADMYHMYLMHQHELRNGATVNFVATGRSMQAECHTQRNKTCTLKSGLWRLSMLLLTHLAWLFPS